MSNTWDVLMSDSSIITVYASDEKQALDLARRQRMIMLGECKDEALTAEIKADDTPFMFIAMG